MLNFTKNRIWLTLLLILVSLPSLLSISLLSDRLDVNEQSNLPIIMYQMLNQAEKRVNESLTVKPHLRSEYSNHNPILIENNSDFSLQASQKGWPGNGSQSDPYQIKGLSITNSSANLITIKNSNVFFQISDNLLDGVNWYKFGILFSNVTNGNFRNNAVIKAEYGIAMISSVNITCISNTVSNNQRKGYYLVDSNNITISDNVITNE